MGGSETFTILEKISLLKGTFNDLHDDSYGNGLTYIERRMKPCELCQQNTPYKDLELAVL